MSGPISRVVTGHDKSGKPIVPSDGPPPAGHTNPLRPTHSQIEPDLNVWRQLNFSNGPGFGLLKSAQLPIMFNPVGLAMPIPGLLDKTHRQRNRKVVKNHKNRGHQT